MELRAARLLETKLFAAARTLSRLMPRKRAYLSARRFQPHAADARAINKLLDVRQCSFGLTPRGRVYGVGGGISDSDVAALLQLPDLIEVSILNLGNTPIFTDDGFEELIGNSAVQIFSSSNNPKLTDRSAKAIARSNRLRWVALNSSTITDIGVHHISNKNRLLGLYLSNTDITEQCVPDLCRLTELRNLSLRETPVTESFRKLLSKHLTKCRNMRLGLLD